MITTLTMIFALGSIFGCLGIMLYLALTRKAIYDEKYEDL